MARPKLPAEMRKDNHTLRFSNWLNTWLNEQDATKTQLVEEALIEYYELEVPKPKLLKSSILDL